MTTYHIHIKGIVQGVGFRPFVYKLAVQKNLMGWVNNTNDGVHIEINADRLKADSLLNNIVQNPPELAIITGTAMFETEKQQFDRFRIIYSEDAGESHVLLTPDFGLCPVCKAEIYDVNNRRYHYPFTTCINCGPRFSIIKKIPYDRENTTMETFEMCDACRNEYNNPADRRYYSQTNSCPDCSIDLLLTDAGGTPVLKGNDTLKEVVSLWKKGKIIAIKGIGGYLLTCDATQPEVIAQLRKRKFRPEKPFAIMYPTIGLLKKELKTNPAEEKALQSVHAPIVLLDVRENTSPGIPVESIAPQLNSIGAMLPYTPLYELLLSAFGKPIVATSGNISGSPIIYEDRQAVEALTGIADFLLTNNRDIVVPQDDSVIRFSPESGKRIISRRSRGLSPAFIQADLKVPATKIFAAGGGLKSTFSLTCFGNFYTSQYLGNLENILTQKSYSSVVGHFFRIFDIKPDVVLADKHPLYFARHFAEETARKFDVPIHYFQHHKAHFAAVLGEHNLFNGNTPILGVIWDGTGFGDDGNIWGGEFFAYRDNVIKRLHHYRYFDHILGDKMAKEPRISALSLCSRIENAAQILEQKFTRQEWHIYQKVLSKKDHLKTSSIGRLFDAVASLLGLLDVSTFEGQGGMLLEKCAAAGFRDAEKNLNPVYFKALNEGEPQIEIKNIIVDILAGVKKEIIAAQFHLSLVALIRHVAENAGIKNLAFSGGVFQNALLSDLIISNLQKDFKLYFHQQLSPNDENISFGQVMLLSIFKG